MREIKLNKAQKEAADHKDGPMLVVAGAGTGKTSVIVERIAKLIEQGVKKSEILTLTFTEKASQEMLDRVAERLNESYGVEMAIHTYNAFGQLLLQEFAVEIGLSSTQKLVGDEGKVVFLREHLDKLELDYFAPVSRPDGQLSTIADYFSQLKQQLVTPEAYQEFARSMPATDEAERLEKTKHQELACAFGNYILLMRQQNIIDYDDQIYLVVELLNKRPNIRKLLQKRYQHIMVDEFQDTNPMQSALIDLLYNPSENIKLGARSLMVVGDDDQAIYGWRGATLANILDFTKRHPEAKQITLIKNYRTTQAILDSAWQLIQENNPDRLEHLNKLDKKLVADRGSGSPPKALQFVQRDSELAWVAEDIKARIEKGQGAGSIAVLARSRQLVSDMHRMLDIFDVEHVVAGLGEELFGQPIILMMIDALRAIWNPQDNTAVYHTITSRLFDCDARLISASAHEANLKKIPLIRLLVESEDDKTKEAAQQIDDWHAQTNKTSVRVMSYQILTESGLKDMLYEEARSDVETAREVQTLSQWFKSLQDFEKITLTPSILSYLENFPVLRAEGETLHDDTLEIAPDKPNIMTMHKAKGLEWQTVYLIGCNAGSFPYLGGSSGIQVPEALRQSSVADERLSEERRLMYVATTRARDELLISYATSSSTGKTTRKPSRFISELGLETAKEVHKDYEMQLERHSTPLPANVALPRRMINGENIVLSASQAEDYLECPLNFYYKHVLGVDSERSYQAEVGSLYHSIIESINNAKLNGTTIPSLDELQQKLVAEWPEQGYSSQLQRKRDFELGIRDFAELYKRILAEPTPLAVEDRFRVHIPDSRCILKGRIDAVMPAGDGVEMHDYKTATSVTDADKAKARTSKSKQLTMYALAWQLTSGEVAKQVSLDFVRTGYVGVVKKLPRSIDSMAQQLTDAVEAIKANQFPLGASHDFCVHP